MGGTSCAERLKREHTARSTTGWRDFDVQFFLFSRSVLYYSRAVCMLMVYSEMTAREVHGMDEGGEEIIRQLVARKPREV